VAIEVREHLLDAARVLPREEQNRDRLFSQSRIPFYRFDDRRAPMLSIVDGQLVAQLDLQRSDVLALLIGQEYRVALVRGGNRGEQVIVLVVQDV
jgi:hypothetical protein